MRTTPHLAPWLACWTLLTLLSLLALPGEPLAQPVLVKDINTAADEGNGFPGQVVDLGDGTLLFGSRDFDAFWLYTSDGTFAGTQRVTDVVEFVPGSALAVMDGIAYFVGRTAAEGVELWRSDGTEAGTFLVKDIYPGPPDSFPSNFVVIGSTLYFSASDPAIGTELFKSDGTLDSG